MANRQLAEEMLRFIENSPVAFFAIDEVEKELASAGFEELSEQRAFRLEKGKSYYVKRNGSAIVAFRIGEKLTEDYGFHIIASHSDSPTFKIKPNPDAKKDAYNQVLVEGYGGMLCSTWLDRPLSVAGRVFVREDGGVRMRKLHIRRDILMIPNLCIHFNRDANSGYAYNIASDLQPFLSQDGDGTPFIDLICSELSISRVQIVNFDLYLYNRERMSLWGKDQEFISAPRLDDLECAFTSMRGFLSGYNPCDINVLFIADNEEVGSKTAQGADGDFLSSVLSRIHLGLGFPEVSLPGVYASSMLISADNAHAVHPNHPEKSDGVNKVYMNRGLAIKFNASQSYTSDGFSASVFQELCVRAGVPYQFFTNRADLRGGSTLGNIALSHASMTAVDVGLPQLAMHSSFETAGAKDLDSAVAVFSLFYSVRIEKDGMNFRLVSQLS